MHALYTCDTGCLKNNLTKVTYSSIFCHHQLQLEMFASVIFHTLPILNQLKCVLLSIL